jgi:hypothetical protein
MGNHHIRENSDECKIGANRRKQKEIKKIKNNNTTTKNPGKKKKSNTARLSSRLLSLILHTSAWKTHSDAWWSCSCTKWSEERRPAYEIYNSGGRQQKRRQEARWSDASEGETS